MHRISTIPKKEAKTEAKVEAKTEIKTQALLPQIKIVDKVNSLCKSKSTKRLAPLNLKHAKADTLCLVGGINFRKAKQKEEKGVMEGWCFWLTVLIHVHLIKGTSKEFFDLCRAFIVATGAREDYLFRKIIPELEVTNWSCIHTSGKRDQEDVSQYLKEIYNITAHQISYSSHKYDMSALLYLFQELKHNELLLLKSDLDPKYQNKCHVVGVIREHYDFLYVETNYDILSTRRYPEAALYMLFFQIQKDLFEAFSIPVGPKLPLYAYRVEVKHEIKLPKVKISSPYQENLTHQAFTKMLRSSRLAVSVPRSTSTPAVKTKSLSHIRKK